MIFERKGDPLEPFWQAECDDFTVTVDFDAGFDPVVVVENGDFELISADVEHQEALSEVFPEWELLLESELVQQFRIEALKAMSGV